MVHNASALGPLLDAFRAAGRRIGEDLSVLAICPDDLAEQSTPALTSIAIPAEEMGRQAVGLLMATLDGQPGARGHPAPPAAHRARQHAPRGHAAPRLSTSRTRVSS